MNEVTAQQRAGDGVLMPSGSFMTAAETLNWIAYQQATNADLTGRNALWREFGFEPVMPPQVGGWDYVVAEAASMLEQEHHSLMQRWQSARGREPKNLQSARDAATRYREARGWSAVELHLYSTGRREICAQRLSKLTQAQYDLVDALAAERLATWATRAVGSGSDCDAQPVGIASAVPWHVFLTHDIMVQPSGSIGVNGEAFLREADRADRAVRTLCMTLTYAGCRLSEALALTVDRVDLAAGVLTFESLKKRRDGVYRSVPVPPALLEALDMVHGIREQQAGKRHSRGVLLWPWSRMTGWRAVHDVMVAARLEGPHASPKGLRHGFGVAAVSAGIPLNLVQKWLGHAQLTTTAIYADAVGAEEKDIARRMWG